MSRPNIIAITGGTCSGKTTIQRVLRETRFPQKIFYIPEIASTLFKGGFPKPGKHLKWSNQWQREFEMAILYAQIAFEEAYVLAAQENKVDLIITDRGCMDIRAYTPEVLEDYLSKHGLTQEALFERYRAVIHLESLATAMPEEYEQHVGVEEDRFEPLDVAKELEAKTRAAWQQHPYWHFVAGSTQIAEKIAKVIQIIKEIIRAD